MLDVVALVWIRVYIIVCRWEIRPKYRGDSAEIFTSPAMVSEGNLIGNFEGSRSGRWDYPNVLDTLHTTHLV
jgi:hypothetical protein